MYKKEKIKNIVIITFILLLAIVSTHYIYYKFREERSIDYNSESLDVVFHETTGDKVTLLRVNPVTDSVGLSSKAYTFTIKNNLTEKVNYQIKLANDIEQTLADECEDYQIPQEFIRVSIKENKKSNIIYSLDELEDALLLETQIPALGENNYFIRVWINKDSTIPTGSLLHYHGQIQIVEENGDLAVK